MTAIKGNPAKTLANFVGFVYYVCMVAQKFFIAITVICLCWRGGMLHAALKLDAYSPARHDRFYTGSDKDFLGDPYDWSGIGRDVTRTRWTTLVSPSYFVGVAHYRPKTGDVLRFYKTNDPDGPFVERTIVWGKQLAPSDLWLGKLDEPVDPEVAVFPILQLPEDSDYYGRLIYTFGQSDPSLYDIGTNVRLGLNEIDPDSIKDRTLEPSTGPTFLFDYDPANGQGADESFVQPFDSGAASFTIFNGAPALVGLHWFNDEDTDPWTSGDTFVPALIDRLRAEMDGESVTVAIYGDLTADGAVNDVDLNVLLSAFGKTEGATLSKGDLDGDGDIDADDLQFLLARFGNAAAASGGPLAVPEPSAIVLAAIAFLAALAAGRRCAR